MRLQNIQSLQIQPACHHGVARVVYTAGINSSYLFNHSHIKGENMKDGLSEIICIIDSSGSMGLIKNDAIGGFNSFLDEQKKLPGEAILTLIQFNTVYNLIH